MARRLVERSLRLPPRADSPGAARTLVREVLAGCDRAEWSDAADLAVTELVTNAVLHAHTDVVVRVRCSPDELQVEVEDSSPAVPTQRAYGKDAPTGRGLALVAAVVTDHGITPVPSGGKIVWFTLDAASQERAFDDLLDAWADDELLEPAVDPENHAVTLVGFPPTLWLAAAQQHDAFLRELALVRAGRGLGVDDLTAVDRARFGIGSALDRALLASRKAGEAWSPLPPDHPARLDEVPPVVDLTVVVPATAAQDFAALQDVLDEAQRLASAGELLMRPALPEVTAVRDWAAEQVIAILAGQPPRVWPGADAVHFVQTTDDAVREIDVDLATVLDGPTTGVVVDTQNRIVGISEPLADNLGWRADDLIGRRVVAIVPPRFREAHVAGLTRHLTTGQSHALGVPLRLPVLRADGTELLCDFMIEAMSTRGGHSVYRAWITPAG